MKLTVHTEEKKKEFKKGDVFQGVSGTYYQIVQDENGKFRALDLSSCELRMDKRDSANAIVNSFLTEDGVHFLREDIEMIIK